MPQAAAEFSWLLLRQVSRSFYWTLRALPGRARYPMALAYLLARTTDTIADTDLISVERRLRALEELRDRILGSSTAPLNFGDLAGEQASPAERSLLELAEANVRAMQNLTEADRARVRAVLETISSGQQLDLNRFAGGSASQIRALKTDAELDDYTYKVAGCVGEFWTSICRAHLFPRASLNDELFVQNGVRFGKGLQLVNILRDVPTDLRNGRCYLPEEKLAQVRLSPADLLAVSNESRLRPVYNGYLDRAEDHLRAGWNYTNTVPWSCARVRLACAWPILIGVETLRLLRIHNVLEPTRRIKIERGRVKKLMIKSVLLYPWRSAWRNLPAIRESVASKALFA
jgi:farnesyl-diphosphate farnesyltransferase